MIKKLPLLAVLFFTTSATYCQSGLCDTAYWNHTYANERLKIYDSCVTMTGTVKIYITPDGVDGIGGTGDGDYHIYVQPDSQYQWMQYHRDSAYSKLCEGSDSSGYEICPTCLNVEEICKGAILDTGGDGVVENAACASFNDTVYLPNIGEYVRATGPFVYDTVHCWNEMHPISRMELVTTGISNPTANITDGLKIFPQPANKYIDFQFAQAPHSTTLIKFYTLTGQQLYICGMSETSLLKVDVSTWPSGEYLYSIISQQQSKLLKSGKFMVTH